MIKTFLNIVFLLVLSNSSLHAFETTPYVVKETNKFSKGKIYFNAGNDTVNSYYIIPNWAGTKEFVYYWKGLKRTNPKAVSFPGDYIYNMAFYKDKLLFLTRHNNQTYLQLINKDYKTVSSKKIKIDPWKFNSETSKWFLSDDHVFLKINDNLLFINIKNNEIETNLIDSKVEDAAIHNNSVYFITSNPNFNVVKKFDTLSQNNTISIIEKNDINKIHIFKNKIVVLSSANGSNTTMIHIKEPENNDNDKFFINSNIDLIEPYYDNNKLRFLYLKQEGNSYSVVSRDHEGKTTIISDFKNNLYEPLKLKILDQKINIFFRNGFFSCFLSGDIFLIYNESFAKYFNTKNEIKILDNNIIISSFNGSEIIFTKKNELWFIKKIMQKASPYLIPGFLLAIAIIFIQLYRHKQRYLKEILETQSLGLVIIIDQNSRLVECNNNARDILGISKSLPLKKSFEYYFIHESAKPLYILINRSFKTRSAINDKIILKNEEGSKEWICRTSILRNIAGQFRGVLLTAFDITEQLERKRLSNWAQLAHDMQTNLSTIRLNAEQMDTDHPGNKDIKKKIITQVNVLFSRVRDIVTVGRKDDNNFKWNSSSEICTEARNEFDEVLFPNVEFETELNEFKIYCDKPKLVRALRNSIENGIKALKGKNGKIKIICRKFEKSGKFIIIDNGSGMDENIKQKMLNPYFTTGENTGGSGIGTMIMQYVTEIHNGDLRIESEKGKGTEIIFNIPLGQNEKYSSNKRNN